MKLGVTLQTPLTHLTLEMGRWKTHTKWFWGQI